MGISSNIETIPKTQGSYDYDRCPPQLLLMEGVPHAKHWALSHLILILTLRGGKITIPILWRRQLRLGEFKQFE